MGSKKGILLTPDDLSRIPGEMKNENQEEHGVGEWEELRITPPGNDEV
ncbi:hypothetical protein KSD_50040 [Ktedonobacter sp. SOSP1-85]|nr:hypothetical protein [Ktedonobacter sp. SOSP1-85]GHO77233.1 hypothetical protein KSD_50040 [Ktedonobacter sp. SOSP1-85]